MSSRVDLFSCHSSVRSRITSYSYNIYAQQVLQGDLYFVRLLAPDLSKSNASTILRNQLAPLKANHRSRAIIAIPALPSPGTLEPWNEARLRMSDLTCMYLTDGEEREVKDVEELLTQVGDCDGIFMITSKKTLPLSVITTFEVIYQPNRGYVMHGINGVNGTDGSGGVDPANGMGWSNGIDEINGANSVGADRSMTLSERHLF